MLTGNASYWSSGAARALQGAVNVARGGPACIRTSSQRCFYCLRLREPVVLGRICSRATRAGRVLGVTERFGIGPYLDPGWRRAVRDRHMQVHPSFRDSSPIGVTEGMLLGKPVLVSDVGGLPELVSDGVTGYVIPVGDQPRFDARLLDLLGSPASPRSSAERGRLAAERRSSAAAMAGSLADVFVNLAKQRRGSRRHEARWRLDRGVMEALHQRYPSAAPCRTTGSGANESWTSL